MSDDPENSDRKYVTPLPYEPRQPDFPTEPLPLIFNNPPTRNRPGLNDLSQTPVRQFVLQDLDVASRRRGGLPPSDAEVSVDALLEYILHADDFELPEPESEPEPQQQAEADSVLLSWPTPTPALEVDVVNPTAGSDAILGAAVDVICRHQENIRIIVLQIAIRLIEKMKRMTEGVAADLPAAHVASLEGALVLAAVCTAFA